MHRITIADAKARLRIPDLWRLCGLPGVPRKSCRCPFHDDHHASFSIFADGQRWMCHARCGGGDAVDFLRHAHGHSPADACREFLRLAGGGYVPAGRVNRRPPPSTPEPVARKIALAGVSTGLPAQWEELATLRHVSPEAVALATRRGVLVFGQWQGRAAWFVTDSARRNAQARRMDGQPWAEIGGKKAWTICEPGNARWPVGANEALLFPCLALCEGGPDLLAAFHFIMAEGREADCSAVAMLGASLGIHPDALSLFAGRRIRIFGHADGESRAGDRAVGRWATQLTHAGATVDALNCAGLRKVDGSAVKDLNDLISIHPDDLQANSEIRRLIP